MLGVLGFLVFLLLVGWGLYSLFEGGELVTPWEFVKGLFRSGG